jgi:hypothetical protein
VRAKLSERDRRAVAVGGLAVLIAAVIRIVLLPYLSRESSLHATLTREEQMLLHDQVLLREARAYPEQFELAAAEFYRFAPRLLATGTEASIQQAIALELQTAARDGGVQLERLEPLASTVVTAGVRSHGCRVDGEGDLEGLLTMLSELESSPTLLVVRDLSIATSAAGEAADPEALQFHFTATGFRLTETADSAAPAGREGG